MRFRLPLTHADQIGERVLMSTRTSRYGKLVESEQFDKYIADMDFVQQ